jgi:hypothetical protein
MNVQKDRPRCSQKEVLILWGPLPTSSARRSAQATPHGPENFDFTSLGLSFIVRARSVAVAVTVGDPFATALAMGRAGQLLHLQLHRRWAVKPIISRRRSASELFSRSVRRAIISLVIGGSSRRVVCCNPTFTGESSMTNREWPRTPPRFATSSLHAVTNFRV